MDRVTDIFEPGSDEATDLDRDLANASHVLQKVAEEAGVDFSLLSKEDVADLLTELLPAEKIASEHTEEPVNEASNQMTQQLPELTNVDVAIELAKIAHRENIDLDSIPREEYHAAYAELEQQMASGEYAKKLAAAKEMETEQQAKLAEARLQGAAMAEGFLERLKQAEEEPENKDKDKDKEEKKDEKEKEAAAILRQRISEKTASSITAVTPATVKKSLDDAALELAVGIIRENGYDPESGQPLAKTASYSAEDVANRAAEILKEKGWL